VKNYELRLAAVLDIAAYLAAYFVRLRIMTMRAKPDNHETTLRYFVELESEIPAACPNCAGEVRHLCPACGARFPSAFLVECEECGATVRPPELFGGPIRKAGK